MERRSAKDYRQKMDATTREPSEMVHIRGLCPVVLRQANDDDRQMTHDKIWCYMTSSKDAKKRSATVSQ